MSFSSMPGCARVARIAKAKRMIPITIGRCAYEYAPRAALALALALAEAATRLSDRSDPVPDEIWEDTARHYDDAALASLVLSIAAINAWNRLNVTTRQPAGSWS
jgi:alkylhydroperoxidase family enzyme